MRQPLPSRYPGQVPPVILSVPAEPRAVELATKGAAVSSASASAGSRGEELPRAPRLVAGWAELPVAAGGAELPRLIGQARPAGAAWSTQARPNQGPEAPLAVLAERVSVLPCEARQPKLGGLLRRQKRTQSNAASIKSR